MESIEDGTLSLDDTITLSHTVTFQEDNVGVSDLTKGCSVTVKNLLYGLLIRSYNDCGVLLAEKIAGSEDAFVEKMNEKAFELGATNTHFVNCHGLHSDDHYTTAYDLYLIFKEAVKHEEFVDTVSSKDYTMTYTTAKKTQINEYMQSTNYYLLNEYISDKESFGGTGLPKGENIRLVCERNHLERAVYLGDIEGDYRSACMAGIPFIHAAYGFGTISDPVPAIHSLRELPEAAAEVLDSIRA